jgi:hypothetical protein
VLDRHAVPRRPAGGDIAVRFPDPVPLTAQLLDELYHGAGCSSSQIELLTGQPQVVVRAWMHRLQIALRPEHMSPALLRLRAAARQDFLALSRPSTAPADPPPRWPNFMTVSPTPCSAGSPKPG